MDRGAYVDINVGYTDQRTSTVYTNTGWRVLTRETNGTVKLISTGHPLIFYSPASGGADSVTAMKTIESGSITLQTSDTARGYQSSGFTPANMSGLFNDSTIFGGLTTSSWSQISSLDKSNNLRTTGYSYWDDARDGACLFRVDTAGDRVAQGAAGTFAIRPVVIINSSVKIKDGNGTQESPYRLNQINY